LTHRLFHHLLVCHSSGAQAVIATDRHLLPVFIPVALESPARSRGGHRGRRIVLSHDRYTTHIPKTRWKRRLADFGRKNVLCMCCGTLRPPSDGGFYTQGCPPAKQSVGTGRTPPPPVIFLPNLAAQSADWNGVPPRRITMAPRDQICSPRPVEVASAVEKLRHAGCFPGSQLSILQTKSKLPKPLAVNFLTDCVPAPKIRKGTPGQWEGEERPAAAEVRGIRGWG